MGAPAERRFHRLAWGTLVYTLGVVLWGTYVRATRSGDGCGSHWPSCHGEVLPVDPAVETLIEVTHRVTSGFAWVLAAVVAVAAWRTFPAGHRARRAGLAVFALMTTEALIGAGVVLLRMVGDNASVARAGWMAGHLINTFLLVAALVLSVRWSAPAARPRRPLPGRSEPERGPHRVLPLLCLVGVVVVSMGGAVAALGDTLFPAASLEEALRQDLSATTHLFIRLRIFHPLLALAVGALVLFTAGQLWASDGRPEVRRAAVAAIGLFVAQLGLGLVNVLLLAPVWMQVVHLLFAHLTWMALLWLEDAARLPVQQDAPRDRLGVLSSAA
ncbi:MAG: COX15/CtaA family protein [Myxococcota bacterium]